MISRVIASGAAAKVEVLQFETPEQEETYNKMIAELRCLVCQNQSLADSDAELAHDLRQEVYDLMQTGQDNGQIVDFMVARYGDFVLYNPPVKPSTYLLWYGPFVLLAIGILFLIKTVRQRTRQSETGFSDQEQARLKAVLGKEADEDT